LKKITGIIFLAALAACSPNRFPQGERLFNYHCANCHMEDGSGLASLIPPLAGSGFLKDNPERVPCIIRYGLKSGILVNGKSYRQEMTGIPDLNEYEITNIINYIHHSWGNDFGYRSVEEVRAALKNCRPASGSEK